jgi:hypothetical protein
MSSNSKIIKCVDCQRTKSETVRLFECLSDLNPKGEKFILCSHCLDTELLLDITVHSECI